MKTYRSRHCSFSVPDNWVAEPPFGFCEESQREGRMSAQVLERWLDEPADAEALLAERLGLLPHLPEYRELEPPGPVTGGPGTGRTMRFHYRDDNEVPLVQRLVIRSLGPLVCELTTSRLDEPAPERDRLLDDIAATFSLVELPHIESCTASPVLDLELGLDRGGGDTGPAGRADVELPHLCIVLPVPHGWRLVEEGDAAVLASEQSRIRVARELQYGGDTDVWYTARLHHVQDTGGRIVASQRGEAEDGRCFAGLLYHEGGKLSTWHTEAAACLLELLVDGEQPLVWTVSGNEYAVGKARSVLEGLLTGTTFLEPSRWLTQVAEPWIDLTLQGPWRPMDTGAYLDTDDSSLVFLCRQQLPSPLGLERKQESILQSVRSGLAKVDEEHHAVADLGGSPSLSYAVDGSNEEGDPVSIRAMWVEPKGDLYTVFLQSHAREKATGLFRACRNALRIEAQSNERGG